MASAKEMEKGTSTSGISVWIASASELSLGFLSVPPFGVLNSFVFAGLDLAWGCFIISFQRFKSTENYEQNPNHQKKR